MKYCEFQCGNIENLGRKVVSYVTLKEFWMLLQNKLLFLWYVKWL